MEKKPLISVLTPSYNSAKFLPRLLDSVLMQDYSNVEMIVVDDGSTDETQNAVNGYVDKFKNRGFALKYIYQPNSGQSAAINAGLKVIEGKYLVWPDSDDFYASADALSRLVFILENNHVGMVRCQIQYLSEDGLIPIPFYASVYKEDSVEDLFEDCLFCQNGFWYQPGDYMIRVSDLDKCIPNRNIYVEKRAGQNWQLMLPLLYKRDCYTISDKLYNVVSRNSSHSHSAFSSYQKGIEMINVYERTIVSTLQSMLNMAEHDKKKYMRKVQLKYLRQRYDFSIDNLRKDAAKHYFKELKNYNMVSASDYFKVLSPMAYKILKKVKRILVR